MATETTLCIAKHNRTPLFFLDRRDFEALVAVKDEIQAELEHFRSVLSGAPADQTYKLQDLVTFEKRYQHHSQSRSGRKGRAPIRSGRSYGKK